MSFARVAVAALSISAGAFVASLIHEGYTDTAVQPLPGDKWTKGFGTTEGVKEGDRTTPIEAIQLALRDMQRYEGALKQCVNVPLYQREYDAYLSLAYNIGPTAFCNSTLVKKLNATDYDGACKEILRWDFFKGQRVRGLTLRRQAEYRTCTGS